ncbi:TlpA family protein disulfide reductase [bacterium]|nr:TlpA family protein disulfide reductase [bacterium]
MKNLTIIFVLFLMLTGCGKKDTIPTVNDGGINFTVKDLDGKTVSLSEYRGKTVLLNIWATWCGPCIKEIPDLKEIHTEQKNNGVVVLGVLLDSESPEKAKPIVYDELKIDYPTWYGDDAFARQFQVAAFPTTVIIDKEGKVVSTMIGQQNKERFMQALKKAGH